MSKFMVLFFAGVAATGSLVGTASPTRANDDGVVEVYPGAPVQVYAGDGWYDATVLQVSVGDVLVRYGDGGADEWVDKSRLSLSGGVQSAGYQPAIQVYASNEWYDGTLLETRGHRYHVRYRGITEWVGADRWHHRARSHDRGHTFVRPDHGGGHDPFVGSRHGGGGVRGDRHGGGVRGDHHRNGDVERHGQVRGGSHGGGRDHGRSGGGRNRGHNRGGSRGGH
ncbi:MAG: hypothetical protein IT385_28795 [Deltaproteobacteria bacterium]|nr:hypothetical protein [Deltaproteobacteria bacterium]